MLTPDDVIRVIAFLDRSHYVLNNSRLADAQVFSRVVAADGVFSGGMSFHA